MAKVLSWAGLDVHARSVLAVTMDASTGEIRRQKLAAETATVVGYLAGLPGPTCVGYEAGPTGTGSRGRCMRRGSGVSSRHRGRSSVRRRTRSRPTFAMLSGCCAC
jgi:hypothetical protein